MSFELSEFIFADCVIFTNFVIGNTNLLVQMWYAKTLIASELHLFCSNFGKCVENEQFKDVTFVYYKALKRCLLAFYAVCIGKSKKNTVSQWARRLGSVRAKLSSIIHLSSITSLSNCLSTSSRPITVRSGRFNFRSSPILFPNFY